MPAQETCGQEPRMLCCGILQDARGHIKEPLYSLCPYSSTGTCMVRLRWHIADGLHASTAQVSVGGLQLDPQTGVQHAGCEIQDANQGSTVQCIFTLPSKYLVDGSTSTVGVLLVHGQQVDTYKGRLLTQLAITLAQAGHVVVRACCSGKEARRLRTAERILDAAAVSPYTRNTTRWVLAGIGRGARVCASLARKCRAQVAGYMLLAYPLLEPMGDGPDVQDSSGPLLKLIAPLLLVQPGHDPLGPVQQVKEVALKVPSYDVRMIEVQGVDAYFRDASTHAPPTEDIRAQLSDVALKFVQALADGSLEECGDSLPRIKHGLDNTPPPPAQPPHPRQLQLPPYHLLVQQHMRVASGGAHSIATLPPPMVSLLLMSQQQQKQQQELLEVAAKQLAARGEVQEAAADASIGPATSAGQHTEQAPEVQTSAEGVQTAMDLDQSMEEQQQHVAVHAPMDTNAAAPPVAGGQDAVLPSG